MKAVSHTLKTVLDAMAFANVSNLGEFRAMLREIDRPAETSVPSSDDALPPPPRVAGFANVQGAL